MIPRSVFASAAAIISLIFPAGLQAQTVGPALVRHPAPIKGAVVGSIQFMTGESFNVAGTANVSGSILVPGTPTITLKSGITYGGTVVGTGGSSPYAYTVTLDTSSTLGHIVNRTDAVALSSVSAPPGPTGSRSVTIASSSDSPGTFSTLKNLTLNSGVGQFAIPAGTYGTFTANTGTGFTLGVAGASTPSVYNFQALALNSGSQLKVVGPVIVTLASGIAINGDVGASANLSWLTLNIFSGNLTLNSSWNFYGTLNAPNSGSLVTLKTGSHFVGSLSCDKLSVESGGSLQPSLVAPNVPPTVALTSPSNNSVFAAPSSILLKASATDSDGTVSKVEFFNGQTSLGTVTTVPFQYTWSNVAAGTYLLTANATDNSGAVTISSAINVVVVAAPVISSPTAASGPVGRTFTYQITATNMPTSYSATGLPPGLSIDTATGIISGTPTIRGTSIVTIGAANAGGTGSASLTITVSKAIPSFTSPLTATGRAGTPFTYQITATDEPSRFDAANLPTGLVVSTTTGLISGTPTTSGNFSVLLSATNESGTGTATLDLGITAALSVITSPSSGTGKVGAPFTFQITASNSPTQYSATALPAGLTIDSSTGMISGTPTRPGTSTVTVTVTNAGGSVPSTLTLTILATLPYYTDFEASEGYLEGPLDSQLGWLVSQGNANVTTADHHTGLMSVTLDPHTPVTTTTQVFAPSTFPVVYADLFAKPVARTLGGTGTVFVADQAKLTFQVSGSSAVLYSFNGDGSGGGVWSPTKFQIPVDGSGRSSDWVRLTARLDFTRQKWDLYGNGVMVAADLNFASSSQYFAAFTAQGDASSSSNTDYLLVQEKNPLFDDINNNGLDDVWEANHEFSLATDNRALSPTGNGVTVVQAYVGGTDPHDFYNGEKPTLTILGGNNQVSPAGQFNLQPFDIGVWNAAGTMPLVNAPVTFSILSGGGKLAQSNTGSPALSDSINLVTDADGTAQLYYKQPITAGILSQIKATAGTATAMFQTASSGAANPDSDGDGLIDAWETKWFGNLNQDGQGDFDGDGLTNRQEMDQVSDPTDYYNGQLPGLLIVDGNNQKGQPGEFLIQPLTVKVTGVGGRVFVNAPITFKVINGSGELAAAFGQPSASVPVSVLSDANGAAKAFLKIPVGVSSSTIVIEAVAVSGEAKASALFTEEALDSFPTPRNIVVELNSGETATRLIAMRNGTANPVTYSFTATNTEAPVDYVLRTSDQANGPTFVWNDIRPTAKWLKTLSSTYYYTPDMFSAVDLSFSFPFYGRSFSRIYISSRGYLTLDRGSDVTYPNDSFPSPYNPGNIIAPFFYSLDPSTGGEIYYLDDGNRITIQYEGMRNGHSDHSTETFQVILYRTGEVVFLYKALGHPGDPIAGMQNADGSRGVSVQGWSPNVLKNEYAVSMSPIARWLSVSPTDGTIAPGEQSASKVVFDASVLPGGTYSADITLHSDYPGREAVNVSAKMIVNALPEAVIVTPADAGRVLLNQSVAITGLATDAEGPITKVEFFDGETKLAEIAQPPYTVTWSASQVGLHNFTLRATDAKGAIGSSKPLSVYVDSDSDNDGLGDEWELANFGNLNQTAAGDFDNDGVTNVDEYRRGLIPTRADSDGDGLGDKDEISAGLDPLEPDAWADSDGDGYPDRWEVANGSDPHLATSVPAATFVVDPAGGGTHATIQAALNAALWDFQIVSVKPGTYKGAGNTNLAVNRKVMLISEKGAAVTKIDGENINGGLTLNKDCLLRGFSVLNCKGSGVSAIGYTTHLIQNCVIANCVAKRGGGVFIRADVELVHCTITDNRADDGQGGSNGNGICVDNGTLTLTNTICWNDAVKDIYVYLGTVKASHSDLREDFAGVGNLKTAPLFTPDYHLLSDSLLRQGGGILSAPSTDMDGETRPVSSAPDIGADQFVDTDNDSLPDIWELKYFGSLSPTAIDDSDADGLSNLIECTYGTDPRSDADSDGDGLMDKAEILIYRTNPLKADTDGDGMSDKYEIDNGLNALVRDEMEDPDGDGYPNIYECLHGSRADNPESIPAADFTVDPSGSGGVFTTLEDAVKATTADYQVVKVNPGVYVAKTGSIDLTNVYKWKLLIISTAGAANTVIDCNGRTRGIDIQAGTAFVGFTVRNAPEKPTSTSGYGNALNIGGLDGVANRTVIANCLITGNRAVNGIVSIYTGRSTLEVFVRHCTFLNNVPTDGGSAFYIDSSYPGQVKVTVSDSILWDRGLSEIASSDSVVTVKNSIVRGGFPGAGILDSDPKLTPSGHLTVDSPARGRGVGLLYSDMDGEIVPAGVPVDLGVDRLVDSDNDGLPDFWELKHFGSLVTQDGDRDSDGDGVSNLIEYRDGTSPTQEADTDGDGIIDRDETLIYHTNPLSADSDGDEVPDGVEIQNGLDPLRDDAMEDTDGDGYPNLFEVMRGSDPRSAASVPNPDYVVALDGTGTHNSVPAACSAASNSGQNYRIILVKPGTYVNQRISLFNQRSLVISAGGGASTILDGGSTASSLAGIYVTTRSAIHGFTIRNFNCDFGPGGALHLSADASISNCVIRNNRATQGACAWVRDCRATFVHCSIINNVAQDAGSSFYIGQLSGVELINSVVWNPGTVSEIKSTGEVVARNSIVREGNLTGVGISADPLIKPDGHLRYLSPARSAGLAGPFAAKDMDGEMRPISGSSDLGADQFSGAGVADADEDGMLDSWELANGLNPMKPDAFEDADGDGVANVYEFSHNTNPHDATSLPTADIVVDGTPGAADPTRGVYATLHGAVAALTQPFQIIEVRPGTYAGGVTVAAATARGVLIRSSAGAPTTFIDGGGSSSGLSVSTDTVVSGFTFTNCLSVAGAGLFIDVAQVKVVNCVFRDNMATDAPGGGIYCSGGDVQVVHCTLFGNTSKDGLGSGIGVAGGRLQVQNSIIWNATAAVAGTSDIEAVPATAASVHASIFHSGGHFTDSGGNLNLDPVLSPAFGHIGANSPAIDAGDPLTSTSRDFEGDPRPAGVQCDIGADEFVDSDADGLNDGWEKALFGNLSRDGSSDSDGDGLSNSEEFNLGTNPQKVDTDGDGLTDLQEARTYHSNPLRTDTDGDGTPDGSEVAKGLDPLKDDTYTDSDGDGIPNAMEVQLGTDPQNEDTDGDGLIDGLEAAQGLNPLVKDYVGPDTTPPPAPTDVTVSEITPSSAKLIWSAVSDPSAPVQYEIWRNNLLVGRTTETNFTDDYGDSGVYPFSYSVLAVDAEGNVSSPSTKIDGSTAAGFHALPGDSDGDGIPDAIDARPNDPSNAFEDDDGDGIQNRDDANPQAYDGAPPYAKILNNDDKVDYVKGETMKITVRGSDPAAKVSIYRNGAKMGDATLVNGIFEFRWENMPVGVFNVRATVIDGKNSRFVTKTFLVDVAEVEAHITFVGPHPSDQEFDRNYSVHSWLDGAEVDRPILWNYRKADDFPASFEQPIDVHYERYYRGPQNVVIYRGGSPVKGGAFKIPAGEKYPLVVLREFRKGGGVVSRIQPYVVNPSTPSPGGMMLKVANFGAIPIYGGLTNYFTYAAIGGTDFNDLNDRKKVLIEATDDAMSVPVEVGPGAINDVFGTGSKISFVEYGDYQASWREWPSHEFDSVPGYPSNVRELVDTPDWIRWYHQYGNLVYEYWAFPQYAAGLGGRGIYCYYRVSKSGRGLLWGSPVPILPEIRLTPFNVGSVLYPGGRGHPANNLKENNIVLRVNDNTDDQPGIADNADTTLGANDSDIARINIKIDLRGRGDVKKVHIQLPVTAEGDSVLRGYYGPPESITVLPGNDFTWSLAEHPELTSDTGFNFFFEGLRSQIDARVKVDVLDDNNVPLNRVYPTQGQPEMVRLDVEPESRLIVDGNADLKIGVDDSDRVTPTTPYRFWINEDDDDGDLIGDDIPKPNASDAADTGLSNDGTVDGTRDLIDFFPVFLDLKQLLTSLPSSSAKYKLKQADSAVNFVYTKLSRADAFKYLTEDKGPIFGFNLDKMAGKAETGRVTAAGVELSDQFLAGIRNENWGIILIEGRRATTKPLILSVEKDGSVLLEVALPLNISGVEKMYRHKSLLYTDVPGAHTANPAPDYGVPGADHTGEPENFPDALTNGKNLIFLHGYNVNPQEARGWESEIFKRMWWSGSRAKFYAITWPGSESQGDVASGVTLNYHANVMNAFGASHALADFVNELNPRGGVVTMAHSLGNMVVMSAIHDWNAPISIHLAIDSAIAIEALDAGAAKNLPNMRDPDWAGYDTKLWASEWHQFFKNRSPEDRREELTWRGRLERSLPKVWNFYSTGEEVLDNAEDEEPNITDGGIFGNNRGRYGWALQEKLKGQHPTDSYVGSSYGGWGFDSRWLTIVSESYTETISPSAATALPDRWWRAQPLFRNGPAALHFLYDPDTQTDSLDYRVPDAFFSSDYNGYNANRLLAEVFPSLTFCMGRNSVKAIDDNALGRQIDLNSPIFKPNGWPAARSSTEWHHSDSRDVAYFYIYPVFDKLVSAGGLK